MTVIAPADGQGGPFHLEFPTREDHIARVIEETGKFYEADMLADARSRLFFPSCVVDVGAHVGNHTIYFAGALGLNTIAFEPNPTNFALLTHNILANGLSERCRLRNVAVGNREGRCVAVRGAANNSGSARIEASIEGEIAMVTLDRELADLPTLDLLKIDVEGWEDEVLLGVQRTLARCRPIIYVETSETTFPKVRSRLADAHYVCWKRFNATPTFLFLPRERLIT